MEHVKYFLARGADPRHAADTGATPIHAALDDQTEKTARYLWDHCDVRDAWAAAGLDEVGFLEEALEREPSLTRASGPFHRSLLHWTARCGAVWATEVILRFGPDVDDLRGPYGAPLHEVMWGAPCHERPPRGPISRDIARLLLDRS